MIQTSRDVRNLLDPRKPKDLLKMLALGFGSFETGPGEPLIERTLDGSPPPPIATSSTRLSRFLHLADIQLLDDESPLRVAKLDSLELASAFRPQEAHGCHLLNAAVRTANALNARDPIDFVMLGGDNIDNAQTNELGWLKAILGGAPSVECDSGWDNQSWTKDPHYPKAPFSPVGLDVPWYWVTGNHDTLVVGNFPPAQFPNKSTGSFSRFGTRVWEFPGGPVMAGLIKSDSERELLTMNALLDAVAEDGDGHGIDPEVKKYGKANYVETKGQIRFIVLDTSAETGGAEGLVRKKDLDSFLKPALEAARADNKWVVVVTHHVSADIKDGNVHGGVKQEDAVDAATWRSLLGSYDNLLMHLAAHSHFNKVNAIKPKTGRSYWEVQTSALADFPHQMRLIEIHDQHNGYLTITGVSVDIAFTGDLLAEDAYKLGVLDTTSGWSPNGSGDLKDRNVRLWIKTK